MYVDDHTYTIKGRTYRRVLLRHSYREGGKTKQRNIANISDCSEEEIQAVKYALKNKNNPDFLRQLTGSKSEYWKIAGPSILLQQVAERLGINKALGNSEEGKYILWQVFCRLIQPGSRLSNVRMAGIHCGCELLGMNTITEKDLYDSLVWLDDQRSRVEQKLFGQTIGKDAGKGTLFLYDVSSSYFEGKYNELAQYGYNRDKKKGKMQLVYGLLTDQHGEPLSIEAFPGNTGDTATVKTQIDKIREKGNCERVVLVGDKGMIKSAQIEDIQKAGMNYITSITKAQIQSLIREGVFQLELFTDDLVEVIDAEDQIRYVLRRNPYRAEEIQQVRLEKTRAIEVRLERSNKYLSEHPRAKLSVQLRDLTAYIEKLKMTAFIEIAAEAEGERRLEIRTNTEAMKEAASLDGCYAIKTDLAEEKEITKETLHSSYKSLSMVEWAFRTKKSQLNIRPIYLRKEHRTRAHLMVCMLAYKMEKYLREQWNDLDITVSEGIEKLSTIVGMKTKLGPKKSIIWIAEPDEQSKELLDRANIVLPKYLPNIETVVSTKEKLVIHRK